MIRTAKESAIKVARKRMGYTQSDLAGMLNVSRSTIAQWEQGRNYPGKKKLYAIQKTIGVMPEEIFEKGVF